MSDILEDLRTALADRYAVEELLGAGGMATVYAAEDLKHHRKVAVKVMDPALAAGLGNDRFLREVRITATLRHPHILPLLDSGEALGLPYYVMPLVEGPSLRERIDRERQLPVEEAVRIAREVADALAYAHSQGVIHRDIKPENILVEGGHAVVADFGIARAASAAAGDRLTRTGVSVGTPAYSSPEQLAGDREVDGRSDVHALGCVLHEMLTGEPPFAGPTLAAVIARKAAGSPTSVRELRPTVPAALERTLVRTLAPLPADRQQTAEELARELTTFLEGGRAEAGASAPTRAVRRRVRVGALLGVGVLALTAGVLWWGRGSGGAPADPLANRVVVLPYENQTGDPSLDPVGRMVADWITEGLAQTPGVLVVPSSMVLQAVAMAGPSGREGGPGPGEVAALTNAGLAVTGSYYRRGDDLEFHSEVVDVASGTPFAAVQPVRGAAGDFEGAIDRVRMQVMGALATRLSDLTGWEIPPTVRPPTYEAFRAYSQGIEDWSRGDYAASADALLRAYRLDTTYVRSLMLAYSAAGNAGESSRRDSVRAMLMARRDRLSPYDQYRLGWSEAQQRGDRSASLAAARAGSRLVPYGTLYHALILTLVEANRPREALTDIEDLAANNPVARRWYVVPDRHSRILHILGEHEQELEVVRKAYEQITAPHDVLSEAEGRALAALGREDELRQLVANVAVAVPGSDFDPGEVLLAIAAEARAHGLQGMPGEVLERGLEWYRTQPVAYRTSFSGKSLEGRLLYEAERWDEAAEVFQALPADSAHLDVLGTVGTLAARRGDRTAADTVAARLASLDPALGSTTLWRARITALLGDRDGAVELLRRAFAEGLAHGLWVHVDMDLEPLRGYPPYEELTRPEG